MVSIAGVHRSADPHCALGSDGHKARLTGSLLASNGSLLFKGLLKGVQRHGTVMSAFLKVSTFGRFLDAKLLYVGEIFRNISVRTSIG